MIMKYTALSTMTAYLHLASCQRTNTVLHIPCAPHTRAMDMAAKSTAPELPIRNAQALVCTEVMDRSACSQATHHFVAEISGGDYGKTCVTTKTISLQSTFA